MPRQENQVQQYPASLWVLFVISVYLCLSRLRGGTFIVPGPPTFANTTSLTNDSSFDPASIAILQRLNQVLESVGDWQELLIQVIFSKLYQIQELAVAMLLL
jgi:hypothetical protein